MKILYCNHELIKYHIAEALVMAGLPMSTTTEGLEEDIKDVEKGLLGYGLLSEEALAHVARGPKLGKAKPGSGHDCYLKGVVVTAVVSCPAYQWPQVQRYHFLDIISSQSKMHRITKMALKSQCNDEVDPWIIDRLNRYISQYNEAQEEVEAIKGWKADTPANAMEKSDATKAAKAKAHKLFRKIINNAPHGLHLAAGIVTNYLQIKTMYIQRENHKLEEWHDDFIAWADSLPYFKEFTGL